MSNTAGSSRTVVALMCGLPASGKSRLAQWLLSACQQEENMDVSHIEYDQIEDSLLATATSDNGDAVDIDNEFTRENWKKSREKSLHILQTMLLQAPTIPQPASPRIILVDDNFHLRSMRREIYRVCQEFTSTGSPEQLIYFIILWLDIPLNVCLQRNEKRSRNVPPEVIERMSSTLEPPGKESWETSFLRIQETTDDDSIRDFVTRTCMQQCPPVAQPPPPVDLEQLHEERRKTRESVLHMWDQRLRSWVGTVAQINKQNTGQANQARKTVLERLRHIQQQGGDHSMPHATMVSEWFLDEMQVTWTNEQLEAFRASIPKSV